MTVKRALNALIKEIVSEAEANSSFRARIEAALGLEERKVRAAEGTDARTREPGSPHSRRRSSHRRTPAVLDPVHLAREGEGVLRSELARLDIEQLRDVVADYGMDTGKLVLKWRDPERIIERIVEVARGRAQKGSAFREQAPTGGSGREATQKPHDTDDESPPKT